MSFTVVKLLRVVKPWKLKPQGGLDITQGVIVPGDAFAVQEENNYINIYYTQKAGEPHE